MSNITSIFQLLTYIQSWSELGANFAVPIEDVCEYFGIDVDTQRLKIVESDCLLDGVYTTSQAYGRLPRLALTQFTSWVFDISQEEVNPSMRVKFEVFREELQTAISENIINPLNAEPKNVGL